MQYADIAICNNVRSLQANILGVRATAGTTHLSSLSEVQVWGKTSAHMNHLEAEQQNMYAVYQ